MTTTFKYLPSNNSHIALYSHRNPYSTPGANTIMIRSAHARTHALTHTHNNNNNNYVQSYSLWWWWWYRWLQNNDDVVDYTIMIMTTMRQELNLCIRSFSRLTWKQTTSKYFKDTQDSKERFLIGQDKRCIFSCLIQLKNILFNLLCVFNLFSERWQSTLCQILLTSK